MRFVFLKLVFFIDNQNIKLVFSNNICVFQGQGQPKIQFTTLTHDSKNEYILSLLDFSFLALEGEANVLRKFSASS